MKAIRLVSNVGRLALFSFLVLASNATAQSESFWSCAGDCNGDRMVQVDEIVLAVNIALGTGDHSTCEAADADGNGKCEINELVLAVNSALNGCPLESVISETVILPSPAEPLDTPGSPGVEVTDPKLIAQFGGTAFSLNNAIYHRFHLDRSGLTADAILILVPGFTRGAMDFKVLAENLIPRMMRDHGLALEIWAHDRRTHFLEDREGIDIALELGDPQVALDWLFGDELGLEMHPALAAGPNRRAVFYDPEEDLAFLANWTSSVMALDLDVVVGEAAEACNGNVFLGGHSYGTYSAMRYAATDFDFEGTGHPDPGYERLRGLVLFDSVGGTWNTNLPDGTAFRVTPLNEDTLDRIEAGFDGGLYGAVRDGEPRCVDGTTPCTIATEEDDCAGQVPPKCTPPTTAFFRDPIGFSPRFLGAGEVLAIQAKNDPDSGQVVLQVDQAAPGNNVIAKVSDLGLLRLMPPSTAHGAFGFLFDDEGMFGFEPRARLLLWSMGAMGPPVGGLSTWFDISEGPMPPEVLPDSGPPPVELPDFNAAAVWGREREVTRIDRVLAAVAAEAGNNVEWYWPSSGVIGMLSVRGVCSDGECTVGNVGASCEDDMDCSQGVGLDSTALSVGRGRRDIVNQTQASEIDIPVLGFGASFGSAPVPGYFTVLGELIAACASPSCDGTPRVIDPAAPSPTFPTFGGPAGGFEVYVPEGFTHFDLLYGEADQNEEVLDPLAAFLVRNVQ